ncbi:MAG TPA: ABC transporter permease [Gammaproteobacteria bacterium]|nr:ABC transporter permease [Gammaproteobacteria bacterium]
MLFHDLIVALRRIARQRFYSAVSVLALAFGLVCFIATYLLVSYVRGYDHQFANVDRTYVIAQSLRAEGSGIDSPFNITSALHLAEHLELDVPELAAVARRQRSFLPVSVDGQTTARQISYVEAPFFDIFDFNTLAGDLRNAAQPRSAVLTHRSAQQMFGESTAVGRTITLAGAERIDVTVVAVIDDVPTASHLAMGSLFSAGFDLLVSWDVFELIGRVPFIDSWGNTPVFTYALLPDDGSLTAAQLNDRLPGIVERHLPEEVRAQITIKFQAQPVSSMAATTLQRQFEGFNGTPWRIDALGTLLIFSAAILAIACLNFVNLATAQSSGRALEIGTRKAVGAAASFVVRQDLVQTAILVTAAIALALAAIPLATKLLTGPWPMAFAMPWWEPRFWLFLAALLSGVTLAAGLYPALAVARIRPTAALRAGAVRAGPKLLRSLLVGAQFGTASFLVALVVVLLAQSDDLRETLLGRFADPYAVFTIAPPAFVPDREVLAREIARGPGIKGATYTFIPPWTAGGPRAQVSRAVEEQSPRFTLDLQAVGYDYFALLDISILAGRAFERERSDDIMPRTPEAYRARQGKPRVVVLDRVAARTLGWPNPADAIGGIFNGGGSPLEVVGVVEPLTMQIRSRDSAGTMFTVDPTISNTWLVRLDKGDVAASLAHIRDTVRALAPGRSPVAITFLDQAFESAYWTFAVMNRVLGALAGFAIAIAAVGLFGMASYMTQRRTREIGVRKTQGASSGAIARLLLSEFSKPVVVANVVAWPFVFAAADAYLAVFTKHIALGPLPFALALLATLALAWLAVGVRVLRAASLNPAAALGHE